MAQSTPIQDFLDDVTGQLVLAMRRRKPLVRGAKLARTIVEERTSQGYDRWGRRFWQYSRSYARREKDGRLEPVTLRNEGALPLPARVNVVASGDIRNRRTVELQPRDPETRRLWDIHHFGKGRVPIRSFIGLTQGEEDRVARHVSYQVRQGLPKDVRRRTVLEVFRR